MSLTKLQWAGIGVVTTALVIFAPSDEEPAQVVKTGKPTASTTSPANKRSIEVGRVELERLVNPDAHQADNRQVSNAFNPMSWYVPPPPPRHVAVPVVIAPPPVIVPTAPPLPFTYLGRYGDTASRTIILSKGERVYTVAVGEVIENTYRLEKLSPGLVHLTHIPTNIEQTLRTGETL